MRNIEIFENFHDNKMSEKDRNTFLHELDHNPALKEDYIAYLIALEGTEEQIASELKSNMALWKDQPAETSKGKNDTKVFKINWRVLAVAASLILVVSAYFATQYTVKSSFNDMAYINSPLRNEDQQQDVYNNAYYEYTHHNYEKAQEYLDQLQESDDKFQDGKIMSAMIFHKLNEKDKAINLISETIILSDIPEKKVFHDKVEYLRVQLDVHYHGITEQNKIWIQDIIQDPDHLYREKTRILYKNERSWWQFFF